MGLNPEDGTDFVSVYSDDIVIFSEMLEDHLRHISLVLERILKFQLKLKPAKCKFIRRELEYLWHLVTPDGLKTNPRIVDSIRQFARPMNVSELRRFIGLASYYRRFIHQFSCIAEPLRALTCKDTPFSWSDSCEDAMTKLKEKLTSAPVLAYPLFDRPFILETDASIGGIGAVLSQTQDDKKVHPIAYASRSLTPAESIAELETLTVVWAVSRFHSYLYGQSVTIFTDHAAVGAILNTPNPFGKHARWWTKVYGTGVGAVQLVYRSGKLNVNADALSRALYGEAPGASILGPVCK